MLARFSLYGFLKNQRYFEPFLILALLERGFTFAHIGILIAAREVTKNLLEIPSGAFADLWGRRRSMVLSFAVYLLALGAFIISDSPWLLAVAMALLGAGDAFRTGTHKAMIFAWLERQGRTDERVKVYGYTRSWSQIGSAVSIPIAATIVFSTGRYTDVFWLTAIPWALDLINLATYPAYLDGQRSDKLSLRAVFAHLRQALGDVLRSPRLRTLMAESMSFEGTYKALKDYLQPVIQLLALSAPILLAVDDEQRTALFIGAVYTALHALSAVASRNAHRVVDLASGPEPAARWLWRAVVIAFALMVPVLVLQWYAAATLALVAVAVLHNLFRPLLVSRIDAVTTSARRATVLSIESQSASLATVILAPVAGLIVDFTLDGNLGDIGGLWPIAVIGLVVTAPMLVLTRQHKQ